MATHKNLPEPIASVFRAENDRLYREAEEFNEVGKSEVMGEVMQGMPSVVKSDLFLVANNAR